MIYEQCEQLFNSKIIWIFAPKLNIWSSNFDHFWWFSNTLLCLGLLSASFLVPLFLPKSESESEAICQNLVGRSNKSEQSFTTASSSALSQEEEQEEKLNALTLPFIIVASWICIAGLGFIFLVISGLQLPNVKENEAQCLKITKKCLTKNWQKYTYRILCWFLARKFKYFQFYRKRSSLRSQCCKMRLFEWFSNSVKRWKKFKTFQLSILNLVNKMTPKFNSYWWYQPQFWYF